LFLSFFGFFCFFVFFKKILFAISACFFQKKLFQFLVIFLAESSIFGFERCFASPNSENGGRFVWFFVLIDYKAFVFTQLKGYSFLSG